MSSQAQTPFAGPEGVRVIDLTSVVKAESETLTSRIKAVLEATHLGIFQPQTPLVSLPIASVIPLLRLNTQHCAPFLPLLLTWRNLNSPPVYCLGTPAFWT